MKILSLTNCPLDSKLGSGKTVLAWTQGLRDLGHTVEVVAPELFEPWLSLGGRVKKFRQAWGALDYVEQRLRQETYDLIEFYGDEFWLITQQLAKLPKRPLIVAHTNGLELLDYQRSQAYNPQSNLVKRWFSQQTHARFSQIAFAQADAFVSLCELDCKYVLSQGLYPADHAAVVEPGLDAEYLSQPFIPQKQDRIVFTGSWISRKGISTLIRVMTQVMTQRPHVHFDLYGTGQPPAAILAHFPETLHARITVYPRLSNQAIAQGLAQAKVFFFPSQYEGFGIALAEAMACSCAAVTTPTGFGAELKHGQEVIRCEFNDAAAMTAAIMELLDNEAWRCQIARQGWQRVQSLRWHTSVAKLDTLYRQWVADHQSTLFSYSVV